MVAPPIPWLSHAARPARRLANFLANHTSTAPAVRGAGAVMDRMSPLDASFLHIEEGNNHMHIGSVTIFEDPAPAYEELLELIARKLPAVPRYRQRAHGIPFGLGRPVWIDDPHFNLAYHVRHTALPAPGDEARLRRLAGRVMS